MLPQSRWRDGDLIIVAAGPSVGKTNLMLDWAYQLSSKSRVAFFEYEMTEHDMMTRILCNQAGVTWEQVEDADLSNSELKRIQAAMNEMYQHDMHVEEVWCDINRLMAKIRREAMLGADIVFVDYLGLIPYRKQGNENAAKAVGTYITGPLKRLASELNLKIVLGSQLNRAGQEPSSFPRLSHLRDSGEIEQDASVVIMLWSDKGLADAREAKNVIRSEVFGDDLEAIEDSSFNLIRVSIEKNRNGQAQVHNWLKFYGNHFRYEEVFPTFEDGSHTRPLFGE
jgi:replicative DNA helicase